MLVLAVSRHLCLWLVIEILILLLINGITLLCIRVCDTGMLILDAVCTNGCEHVTSRNMLILSSCP